MGTITNAAVGTSDVWVDDRPEESPTSPLIANYIRMIPTDLEKFDGSDQVILLHGKQTKPAKKKTPAKRKPAKKPKKT